MADFKAHFLASSAIAVFLAAGFHAAGLATSRDVAVYAILGSLGGVLPDVDSDHSIPTQVLFNVLAVTSAFFATYGKMTAYSLAELFVLWTGVYLIVRYGVYKIFARFTVHRGVIHSIPAGLLFAFAAAAISHRVFHLSSAVSWMNGFFLFIGYITHLVLDEISSVDLTSAQIKRSLGSGLKLFSFQYPWTSLLICLLAVAVFWLAPSPRAFLRSLADGKVCRTLYHRILPRDGWFKDLRKEGLWWTGN